MTVVIQERAVTNMTVPMSFISLFETLLCMFQMIFQLTDLLVTIVIRNVYITELSVLDWVVTMGMKSQYLPKPGKCIVDLGDNILCILVIYI